MTAYYNEFDPFAAAWLRELIKAGHIAKGTVDERSIRDVRPSDLAGFDQCHFFAGIGGWSRALRLAGWPDDRPVWTGSCPCKPFSVAGKRGGTADDRHLWPEFYRLINLCRPPVVFGEQVASPDGLAWFDAVHADLEASDYAVGAVDLCAASVGAPHIRQRLWFVGESDGAGSQQRNARPATDGYRHSVESTGRAIGVADTGRERDERRTIVGEQRGAASSVEGSARKRERRGPNACGDGAGGDALGNAIDSGLQRHGRSIEIRGEDGGTTRHDTASGATRGFWSPADWIACRDGKARPVEPGTFPLAYGIPARVGRLRGYGNAIVPQVAQEVIKTYMEWSAL